MIYGVEGYLVDSPWKDSRMYHIVLLAENQEGLVNLYKLISISHMQYYHRRPRIPREVLKAHRSGILVGSACEAGELYQAILNGRRDEEVEEIARFYDYLEIQPLANNYFLLDEGRLESEEDLKEINRRIVRLGQKLGKPVVATGDVHFLKPEDEVFRQIIMAGHGFDVERATPLYLRTTREMLEEFAYLGEELAYEVVVKRPRELAESVESMRPVPDGFHPPHIPGAEEKIRTMATERAKAIYGQELPPLVARPAGARALVDHRQRLRLALPHRSQARRPIPARRVSRGLARVSGLLARRHDVPDHRGQSLAAALHLPRMPLL